MNNNDALSTLNEIKDMMAKSSRFQTISGLSIIIIGLYASLVSLVTWLVLGNHGPIDWLPAVCNDFHLNTPRQTFIAISLAALLVLVSFGTVSLMSLAKTKKKNPAFTIDSTVRRPIFHFMVPAVAGGLFCIAMLMQHHYGLTSSIMLIFYGLSLINCHHYTTSSIGMLGYGQLILGIIDCFVVSHAILFWFLGFGVLHIVYGIYYIVNEKRTQK